MDEKMREFLFKAKRATYAGAGGMGDPARPGSAEWQFEEGPYKYVDSCFGDSYFAGQEIIWCDGVPSWATNYLGRALHDASSSAFLREAILKVFDSYPLKGPLTYSKGDYTYTCSIKGNLSWFYGYEEILYKGERVYEAAFHGGDLC